MKHFENIKENSEHRISIMIRKCEVVRRPNGGEGGKTL